MSYAVLQPGHQDTKVVNASQSGWEGWPECFSGRRKDCGEVDLNQAWRAGWKTDDDARLESGKLVFSIKLLTLCSGFPSLWV